ncbi:MAG: hypothetical protein COA42_06500 [Alteromonadaceae bacterium]|nr:MAG: hypothetical protein COA42_06500 [Alteromonadaceae bacterium]
MNLFIRLSACACLLFTASFIGMSPVYSASYTPASNACVASLDWFKKPSFPSEVPDGGTTNCNFQQFSWQSFIAAVQPTGEKTPQGGILEFESWMPSYGIFVEKGQQPTPWGQQPDLPNSECVAVANKKQVSRFFRDNPTGSRLNSNATDQAGSNQPLLDLQGNFVFYDISVNKKSYDFITACELFKSNCASSLKFNGEGINLPASLAFPAASAELKTAWMIMTKELDKNLFYRSFGNVVNPDTNKCEHVELGLVGMHLVINTDKHPEFIWATFEHRNNVPNCADRKAKPPLGGEWNFFNPECLGAHCQLNTYSPSHPGQICRTNPEGSPSNTMGMSKEQIAASKRNRENIISINTSVQDFVRGNPKLIDSIWTNYEMTGNVWTLNGILPPTGGRQGVQRGSLSAANAVMETYLQDGLAEVNPQFNCFGCHTTGFGKPPAGLSHIFDEVVPMTGGCENGKLPASCPQ